jgi:hypothetical protein
MASAKPRGAYKAAQAGVEIRRRFFSFKEDIERGLGVPAIWYADGALMVHPKLREELRQQPDAEVLETALTHCFVRKDALHETNEAWPSVVDLYRGKDNSEPVLAEKSGLLAKHVVNNLDAAELGAAIVAHIEERELPDKHDHVVRVEEAAVWYRVLDELAFRFLRGQRDMLMDFF